MKKIIVTAAVSAAAIVGFAGTASAFEPGTPQCFGQVHKAVNGGLLEGAGINNVGDLVKSDLVKIDGANKGQGKKALATSLCA